MTSTCALWLALMNDASAYHAHLGVLFQTILAEQVPPEYFSVKWEFGLFSIVEESYETGVVIV